MPDQSNAVPRLLLFEYTELNPAFRGNPHALLDPQRAARPAEHDGMMPILLVSAYDAGRDVLQDKGLTRDFSDAAENNPVIASVFKIGDQVEAEFGPHVSMLTLEDPDHGRVRAVIAPILLKRAAAMQGRIKAMVDDLLDALAVRGAFDAVGDYATHVPIRVLGALLGCPDEALPDLKRWTEAGQSAFDPTRTPEQERAALEGRRGLLSFFRDLVAQRRAAPRDDMISELVAAQAAGAPLSDNELLHNLFGLLTAGHLTTADLIGNGIWLLLTHDETRQALAADAALWPSAVEEMLRCEPPISATARFSKTDGAVAGCPYHAGDGLAVSLIAVNRDPAKFTDPHRFDITRKPNAHMAFGAGSHICIGAPLARIEGQIALSKLFERFPELRLAEPSAPPDWRPVLGVRGLSKLDVVL
jgi:cytochrome P450